MPTSANGDLYTPFPQGMIPDEAPTSSEEGSGLHSPIFGAPFPPHGNIRYQQHDQLDVQQAAGILATHFDYNHSLPPNVQQPPLLDTDAVSSPGHHSISYPPDYLLPHRNHNGLDFPQQSPTTARLPPPPAHDRPLDYRYASPPERPLPGGHSHPHDTPYSRPNARMHVPDDHRSAPRADPAPAAGASRESRKEISTVVIACRQCRGRKIRCDSTRPVCNNCVRRSNECQYDAVPKRRGPDKRPGTRQRSCKKRPADGSAPPPPSKRKRTADRSSHDRDLPVSKLKENMSKQPPPLHPDRPQDVRGSAQQQPSSPSDVVTAQGFLKTESSPAARRHSSFPYEHEPYAKSYPRQLDMNVVQQDNSHPKFPLPSSPSVEYSQKLWWDSFTTTYALKDIVSDLTYLFNDTGYWLCFINLNFLVSALWDPAQRVLIQPSFILAGLAMATLMKSSESEGGAAGRSRAMWLRDSAQKLLLESYNARWIDTPLAEAALILAFFESSVHPQYNPDRVANALVLLDNIIHAIGLTTNDYNDPDVSIFPPRAVPSVMDPNAKNAGPQDERKCACIPLDAAHPPDHYSSWAYPLPWDNSWDAHEVRNEECRRLCWCALGLVASFTAQCAAFNREPPNLYLNDPASYALLFPGEALDRMSPSYRSAQSPSPKESIWALYCRSMLLWSFCLRLRTEATSSDNTAELAQEAFAESQAIQDSLDIHVCNLDTALIYLCREYIFNTQLTITQSLRSLLGLDRGTSPAVPGTVFNRKQAEEWLYYQDQVIRRVKLSLPHVADSPSHQLAHKPYQVTWFSNQLAICLLLWNRDHTLVHALELGKAILGPVDMLNALWPCTLHQSHCADLRARLVEACTNIGLEPPPPLSQSAPTSAPYRRA